MTKALQSPPGYAALLKDIKERVRTAQMRAALAVNRELILLYWSIGRDILVRQQAEGWGTKVIERLAKDLGAEFPGVEGFSPRSLKYMRTFAREWPDESIAQQVAAQLPWGHHMVLLDRIKNRTTREWYLQSAVEHGWSRNVLVHQISRRLHERQGSLEKNHATYRKQCVALGMEIHQDGDTEFAATFDPKNEKQAKQAIRVAGCRFPGHRESTTPKKVVNCVALERGSSPNFASESLG